MAWVLPLLAVAGAATAIDRLIELPAKIKKNKPRDTNRSRSRHSSPRPEKQRRRNSSQPRCMCCRPPPPGEYRRYRHYRWQDGVYEYEEFERWSVPAGKDHGDDAEDVEGLPEYEGWRDGPPPVYDGRRGREDLVVRRALPAPPTTEGGRRWSVAG